MVKCKGHATPASVRRQNERAFVLGMAVGGVTLARMCRKTGLHRTTITRILQRAKQRKTLADAPRPGRPSIITPALKRQVKSLMLDSMHGSKRRVSAVLRRNGTNVGSTTVRKVAKSMGLKVRVRRYKWLLTADQRTARVAFATAHQYDSVRQRRKTVYLDEKLFVCNVKKRFVWYENVDQRQFDAPRT